MTRTRKVIQYILADLDDTLYINEAVPKFVRGQIIDYIQRYVLNCSHEQAVKVCMDLYVSHGTTLAGLVATGHSIDFDHFHAHVHGHIRYAELVRPDPALRDLLLSIPLPKSVLTNADSKHAWICLENLGIDQDVFEHVVCFESVMEAAAAKGWTKPMAAMPPMPSDRAPPPMGPVICKPNAKAFALAMEQCGITDPTSILFLDDSARNIAGAKALGMTTCIVGRSDIEGVAGADFAVASLHDLPRVLPELFQGAAGGADVLPSDAMEDDVSDTVKSDVAAQRIELSVAAGAGGAT